MLAVVAMKGRALQHASEALQADRDLVLAAVAASTLDSDSPLEFASDDLKAEISADV